MNSLLLLLFAAIGFAEISMEKNEMIRKLMKPVTNTWGEWGDWTNPCPKTCRNEGMILQTRYRYCKTEDGHCHQFGFTVQTGLEDCDYGPCPGEAGYEQYKVEKRKRDEKEQETLRQAMEEEQNRRNAANAQFQPEPEKPQRPKKYNREPISRPPSVPDPDAEEEASCSANTEDTEDSCSAQGTEENSSG